VPWISDPLERRVEGQREHRERDHAGLEQNDLAQQQVRRGRDDLTPVGEQPRRRVPPD
jgi:hypothetical protein